MYFLNNNAIQYASIDDQNILTINTLFSVSSSSNLYYLMWDDDANCFWVSDVKTTCTMALFTKFQKMENYF